MSESVKCPYPTGTPPVEILKDCWSRGFLPSQTLNKLRLCGYIHYEEGKVLDFYDEMDAAYWANDDFLTKESVVLLELGQI